MEDQIRAALSILRKKKYENIDTSKVAIWGRNYGGFLTAAALSHRENTQNRRENVFSCGIAVAPVTDWRWVSEIVEVLSL